MPDDLAGYGYCGACKVIHARDADGLMCDDARPLPRARVLAKPDAKTLFEIFGPTMLIVAGLAYLASRYFA